MNRNSFLQSISIYGHLLYTSQSVYGHKLHCTNSGAKSGTDCTVVNHNFCVLYRLHCRSFNTYNFAFRFMLHRCDTTIWLSVPAKDSSWALCGSIKLTHTVCPVTLSTSCCRVVKGVLWLFESHRAVKHVRFRIETGKFRSWLSLKFITCILGRWPNSAGTSCNLLLRTLRMVKLVQLPISES